MTGKIGRSGGVAEGKKWGDAAGGEEY